MATIATLAVKLLGDVSGLKSALGEAQASIKATGERLTSMGAGLTASVTAPILGVGAGALKIAGDFEQTKIALTTMLGSGEKATALFNDMRQFSASTPFEFPQIAEAGKMLLAFGIDSEKVIPKMKGLGDIASGVGIPIKDLALIYGQASVSGRVMTGDLNQLVGRGVPILSALAKTMGVTEQQVRDMAQEGKVGFADFDKAISSLTDKGGQFAGMMDAQSQSLLGLLSTFKDNITLTLADVGTVLMETFDLKGVLASLNTFLGGISAKISDFAKNNPAMFKFVAILVAAAAAAGPLLMAIGWVTGMIASAIPVVTAIAGVLGTVAGAFSFLLGPIGLVVLAVGALIYLNWDSIVAAVQSVIDVFGTLGSYFQLVVEDGDYLNDFLADIPGWMQPAVEWLGQLAVGVMALGSYFQLVVEDGDYLNDFLADMPGWMQPVAEWLGHLTVGVMALGSYFQLVVEDGDYLNDFLADMPGWMQPAVEWLGRLTAGFIELTSGTDFANLKSEVTGAFGDMWQAVKGFFSGDLSLDSLGTALSDGFTRIRDALGDFFGGTDFGKFLGTIQWSEFIEKLTWENIIAKMNTWGDYITALVWWEVLPVLEDWGAYIVSLPWGDYITKIEDWGLWILQLSWGAFITLLDWGLWLLKLDWAFWLEVLKWDAWLIKLAWDTFIPVLADWGAYIVSLPWGDYIAALTDWGIYIAALAWAEILPVLTDWGAYIVNLPWGDYIAALTDWGAYIAALVWAEILTVLTDWGTYIVSLDWTAFVVQLLDWATWVPALAWNALIALLDWGTYVALLDWGTSVPAVDWSVYIKAALDWGAYVVALPWGSYIKAALDWAAYVGALTWGNFVSKLNWPASTTSFAWSNWISALTWPDLSFSWDDYVPDLRWPDLSFSWDDYVPHISIPQFPGWDSLWSWITGGGSQQTQPRNALGTAYWGGGATWVGERGPELLIPPRGSQIVPNQRAMELAGAGGPAVVIQNMTLRDERDAYTLAYQVEDLRRRRRL